MISAFVIIALTVGLALKLSKFLENKFEIAGFVLAVVAIVFASKQFMDAHEHSRKMEEIASSMSTRYVGDFPKNLDDIVEVAGLADREILVLANFVDYGHYSKPESFERFLEKLHSALSRNVAVRFLVYNDALAAEILEKRFPEDQFGEESQTTRFRNFFATYYKGIRKPDNHKDFLGVLRRKRREVAMDLFDHGAKISTLSKQEQVFFWLEDSEDTVFSFENVGSGDPLCFRTRDAKLIETFSEMFEQSWKSAPDYLKELRMPIATIRQASGSEPSSPTPPIRIVAPHNYPPSVGK
jgi:hypothetical protein